jgi:2-polyprenyl-6-hydroxyphenyl methylase/3-demethylubiquinone-9 3-methyltransferase
MVKSFYQAETPEEALEIYFKSKNEIYGRMKDRIMEKLLCDTYKADPWNSLKVLEVGAGGGTWTEFFLGKGASVTCVDTSEQILKGNAKLHPQANFILADATTVRLEDEFDLVFAKDVIEHIPKDEEFLRNMNRHLKNGGLMIINTQNSWSLNYLIQGGYHRLKGDKNWCGWDPTHVRFYNFASLRRKLKAAGFKTTRWAGSYYFPYRILSGRLGIKTGLKFFNGVELLHLYDKPLFNITGWNIGVVAEKRAKMKIDNENRL